MQVKYRIKAPFWRIAYRTQGEDMWHFAPLVKDGWAADPFLCSYKDTTVLFAEIWDYNSLKGHIGYSLWNEKEKRFTDWSNAIIESWHLSYPCIFEFCGKLFMVPEQHQSGEIAFYECIEFPSKWQRKSPIVSDKEYVDSTMFKYNGQRWLFSYKINEKNRTKGELVRFLLNENNEICKEEYLYDDSERKKRPAGNFFFKENKLLRPAQFSDIEYGQEIILYEVGIINGEYSEKEYRRIQTKDIYLEKNDNKVYYLGIHTYNNNGEIEVIDLKERRFYIKEFISRIKEKIKI